MDGWDAQLQDAVPMTLGQEFNSFASTIAADLQFLEEVGRRFHTCNMGGTAIGTGIAVSPLLIIHASICHKLEPELVPGPERA